MARATAEANGHAPASLLELLAMPAPFEDVELPEYGGRVVRLHAITGSARQVLAGRADSDMDAATRLEFAHELVATAMGDGATPEQVGALAATAIDRLTAAALRLTGLGEAAQAQAEAGLKATPAGDSG